MKNMKKFLILISCIVLLGFVVGCSSDDDKNIKLSDKEKALIVSDYGKLSEDISDIFENIEKPLPADFQSIIAGIRQYASVEDAYIDGDALYVKFLKGGTISWILTVREDIIPPFMGELKTSSSIPLIKSVQTPSNNNACLINQQWGDDGRQYCKDYIDQLSVICQNSGYEVTVKNGEEANINFFKRDLDNYGVVFCINHGLHDTNKNITWLCTGEEASAIEQLFELYLTPWNNNEISIGTVSEKRNGERVEISYFTISDRFFNTEYSNNSFPNSLVYWVACQGMKSSVLGETLHKKGVGVTVGWDETNCLGQSTGFLLFQTLLGGYSVEEAFQSLPSESKKDACSIVSGANLVYYPNSGGGMYLTKAPTTSVTIHSPLNGQAYNERVVILSGEGNGFDHIESGTVEVNGIATTLTLTDRTSFSQPVELNDGENHIKINCSGVMENGKQTFASAELVIVGDFPVLALYTQLRWNTDYTDVDFHLLPPGSNFSDLWTNKDCFYANRHVSWGAFLDMDDVDGYGPEHITIPMNPASGRYTLYVHYYASHGGNDPKAFVSVSANNGIIKQFTSPRNLIYNGGDEAGDVWEVCTIDYPSGTITPVNQMHNLSTTKSFHIPAKGVTKNSTK